METGARLIELTDGSLRDHALADVTLIGRGSDCGIHVDDPMVAMRHAEVRREADRWVVTDLGTRTGTFVGGERIASVEIKDGDELLIGPVRLRFSEGAATASARGPRREDHRVVSPEGRPALGVADSGAPGEERPRATFGGLTRRATRSADAPLPGEVSELRPEAIRTEFEKLRIGLSLARELALEHDPHRVLERVVRTLLSALSADRALASALDHEMRPTDSVARSRDGEDADVVVSSTMVSEALGTRRGVLYAGAAMNDRLSRSRSIYAQNITAAMCVPMIVQDQVVGLVHVDAQRGADHFSEQDLDLVSVIAAQAAIAIQNARLVRAVETSTRKEAARVRRILGALPDGVLLLDAAQVVIANNERATELMEGLAKHDEAGALASIGPWAVSDMIARAGEPFEVEVPGKPPRALVISARAGVAGRKSGDAVLVVRDVTDERQREEQAARTERLALVGRLASGIAHDYNNVISVVLNYGALIAEESTDPQIIEDAREIVQAAERAADLTKQLLSFGRRDLGHPIVADVGPIIRAVVRLFGRPAGERFSVVEEIASSTMPVLIDPSKLDRVLMNLLVNARDAMPGGGKIHLRCAIVRLSGSAASSAGVAAGEWVEIDVIDQGTGMPPEVVSRAFEPFFTTKEPGRGTGLGLATSYSIVQQAGGNILIDSAVGRGTTIRVLLPASAAIPSSRPVTSGSAAEAKPGVVLVVDGDEMSRRIIRRHLVRAGHTVLLAADAAEALRIADEDQPIDAILTDLTPPGASGKELVKQILARRPDVGAAFMSAYYDAGAARRTVLDDGELFLPKPFGRDELHAAVGSALRRSRRRRSAVHP